MKPEQLAEARMLDLEFAELPAVVREFRPKCPGCTPAKLTEPGARPCSFYDCSGLPKELEVVCNTCVYDFAAEDGQVKCDHDTCETALRLKGNVATYRTWLRLIREEGGLAGVSSQAAETPGL